MFPLVSAIMPTRGRREWAKCAVECFLAQDYPNKELVILDDADDPSFDGDAVFPAGVSYFRSLNRQSIASKRNELCGLSHGEIICHWDSDDYSVPTRISDQVTRIHEGATLTGYYSMLWWDGQRAFVRPGHSGELLGTSLMYRREQWMKSPFRDAMHGDIKYGEDNRFRSDAKRAGAVVSAIEGRGMMVARIHPGNTSAKDTTQAQYKPIDAAELPEGFPR